ncbi:unnamed protein product [Nyctereutes procyonoides]|uniref:Large ribosomal subunit protein uL22m n=1 Tax=Nyctereutes procyonoides TaxID=34880 RepID=A0A811ZQH0_NYCPR|nr:unnamed protein product [Nyctereutes procyonoides]
MTSLVQVSAIAIERRNMAAILKYLGALWRQNLRGKLALGLISSHDVLPQSHIHMSGQIKYSKDKMWYLALAQLEFSDKKGTQIIKEILLEAQDMACEIVRDHNVEFRSNLYIAELTSGRGQYLKFIRYHGRGFFEIMEKVYGHYFVKLVEGPPPPRVAPRTAVTHAKEYIQELLTRTIIHILMGDSDSTVYIFCHLILKNKL